MTANISGKTAIVGVGQTKIAKQPGRHPHDMAIEAFKKALDDGGLEKGDIDGLFMNCMGLGNDYDRLLENIGIDVNYAYQGWYHGRFFVPLLQYAAMTVNAGMTDYAMVINSHSMTGTFGSSFGAEAKEEQEFNFPWIEAFRQGGGPHNEHAQFGATSAGFAPAIAMQRYFHMYGGGEEDLAAISVSIRKNAALNPGATYQKPLTVEDYLNSRYIIEPLHLFDFCQVSDAASCIIITTAERAKDLKQDPVYLLGMQGVHAGRQYHNLTLPGLGVWQQDAFKYEPDDVRCFEMSGISQKDVDAVGCYDAFSPEVLFSLERFGFCPTGEGLNFVQDGTITVDGELPVNTSGGLLSEGHNLGFNHIIEIVHQLRGNCGKRQVKDAEIMAWASFLGEAIIFGKAIP